MCIPGAPAEGQWDFPPPPPPEEYGNLLINRTSGKNSVKAAAFSHWLHRRKYTCRVCHSELEFAMEVNATEITEEANRSGKFCGACHNGALAFDHKGQHCERCHTGDRKTGRDKFALLSTLPRARFGNGIDWSRALAAGLIQPARYLAVKPAEDMSFSETLTLEAEWSNIPPAIFPHKKHSAWLDCNTCHPDIFNIKKKTTKHFAMTKILNGQFCGVCHLKVAFPIEDCRRCHPKMKNRER